MTVIKTDVVIIGAGPVGLFAIFECGMMGLSVHVIEALEATGGQCRALYPEKPIYDIPGHPEILAGALIDNLEKQAAPFNPTYHLNQQVTKITNLNDKWQVETSTGTQFEATCVIVAAGVGAFGPNRPPLENLEAYEGKSVFYMVKKREDFRGKKIVVAGGGDSALDWAISLYDLAEKIYVIHRRDKFRAAPDSVAKLQELAKTDKLELVIPYQLDSLRGANGTLDSIGVKTLDGQEKILDADTLLAFFGLSMNLGPILEWGLNLDNDRITINPTTAETSLKGIYAIGDIATYPHKNKLILTGFSEAAFAAHQARTRCKPNEVFHFEYSTTKGVPG